MTRVSWLAILPVAQVLAGAVLTLQGAGNAVYLADGMTNERARFERELRKALGKPDGGDPRRKMPIYLGMAVVGVILLATASRTAEILAPSR